MDVEDSKHMEENQEGEEKKIDVSKLSTFNIEYDRNDLDDLLRIYYSRLFPFVKFYEWLAYGKRASFSVSSVF